MKTMPPAELAIIGRRLCGSRRWIMKLALLIDRDVSTVWRWAEGKVAIPPRMALRLRRLSDEHRERRRMLKEAKAASSYGEDILGLLSPEP